MNFPLLLSSKKKAYILLRTNKIFLASLVVLDTNNFEHQHERSQITISFFILTNSCTRRIVWTLAFLSNTCISADRQPNEIIEWIRNFFFSFFFFGHFIETIKNHKLYQYAILFVVIIFFLPKNNWRKMNDVFWITRSLILFIAHESQTKFFFEWFFSFFLDFQVVKILSKNWNKEQRNCAFSVSGSSKNQSLKY